MGGEGLETGASPDRNMFFLDAMSMHSYLAMCIVRPKVAMQPLAVILEGTA